MSLRYLSKAEREVVYQCIVALRKGQYLHDFEIPSRIGVRLESYDDVINRWPDVDDSDDESDVTLIINNALNEICHGVVISGSNWTRWFNTTRDQVKSIYRKWLLGRGWAFGGIQ